MRKKISRKIAFWLGIVAVGVVLGFALQFVRAWTEPSASPPGGNLGAPINTSGSGQTKAGPMGVNSNGLGLPLQLGLDTGGKTQADDFCLRSDLTKCLSSPSNLRVGPPGCGSILTSSATCNTQACGEYSTTAYVPAGSYSGYIAVPATLYFTCDGSCSAGSPVTCPTNPI